TFTGGRGPTSDYFLAVKSIVPLGNGDIFVGGTFENSDGASAANMMVLDGATLARRTTFGGGAENGIAGAAVIGDRLVVGGTFPHIGYERRLVRLDASGALDRGFNAPAGALPPEATALAADDRWVYFVNGTRVDRASGDVDPQWSFTTNLRPS